MNGDDTSPDGALDAALARLPREQAPARDLWPAIERGLHGGAVRPAQVIGQGKGQGIVLGRFQLAASLAGLALLGALAWSVRGTRQEPVAALVPAPGAAAIPAGALYGPPDDAGYEAARASLERTFEERLDLLAPATRTRVRADLATIRAANADLRAALAKDPASPLLLQLLASTWRQEIELYASVARSTSPLIQRRTRT